MDDLQAINLLYDEDYGDADILLVPSIVASNLEDVLQEFFDSIKEPDNRKKYEVYNDNRIVLCVDTIDFVDWLNNHKIYGKQESSIVKHNTQYIRGNPTVVF